MKLSMATYMLHIVWGESDDVRGLASLQKKIKICRLQEIKFYDLLSKPVKRFMHYTVYRLIVNQFF